MTPRNPTSWRQWNTRYRMSTVVHPRITDKSQMSRTKADYVDVPTIATRGRWKVTQMISDAEMLALVKLYAQLERVSPATLINRLTEYA